MFPTGFIVNERTVYRINYAPHDFIHMKVGQESVNYLTLRNQKL